MREKTFCMVKPDGVSRGLVDKINQRIEKSGLKILQEQTIHMSLDDAKKLYKIHEGKSFYAGLIKFITSAPVVVMELEGNNAILALRDVMGATDPSKAVKGSIRGDFREDNFLTEDGTIKNIIHGSDSAENAKYEAGIFFTDLM